MSEKLWTGRFSKQLSDTANDYNASIRFDSRMYKQDITGSMAHAAMLSAMVGTSGDGDGIGGERFLLNVGNKQIYTVRERQNEGDADDADAACHTDQQRTGLFGHQVVEG